MSIPVYKLSKKYNLLSSATDKTVVVSHDNVSIVKNDTHQIFEKENDSNEIKTQYLLYSIDELTDISNHCIVFIIIVIIINSE